VPGVPHQRRDVVPDALLHGRGVAFHAQPRRQPRSVRRTAARRARVARAQRAGGHRRADQEADRDDPGSDRDRDRDRRGHVSHRAGRARDAGHVAPRETIDDSGPRGAAPAPRRIPTAEPRLEGGAGMASVTLGGLSKTYAEGGGGSGGGRGAAGPVLRDLSLDVRDGEFLALLGPSGSGKTTLLKCIAGLEEPSAGEILIGERNVTQLAPAARDVALVFQHYALYPHLTVRANIAFGLEVRRVPAAEVTRRVQETATRLGIATLLDRRPGELSGGERQRVALGRAVVREPQVFLFDEPLSSLDPPLRSELRAEVLALHATLGAT